MPRYLKWDFTNKKVTEYRRIGECNGCAACCKATIAYRVAGRRTGKSDIVEMAKDNPPDYNAGVMGDELEREGVWSEYQDDNGQRRFIRLPEITFPEGHACGLLIDNKCIVHERKSINALTLCMTWPIIPEHVSPFKECSYSFEEIGSWDLDDNQKPILPDEVK